MGSSAGELIWDGKKAALGFVAGQGFALARLVLQICKLFTVDDRFVSERSEERNVFNLLPVYRKPGCIVQSNHHRKSLTSVKLWHPTSSSCSDSTGSGPIDMCLINTMRSAKQKMNSEVLLTHSKANPNFSPESHVLKFQNKLDFSANKL